MRYDWSAMFCNVMQCIAMYCNCPRVCEATYVSRCLCVACGRDWGRGLKLNGAGVPFRVGAGNVCGGDIHGHWQAVHLGMPTKIPRLFKEFNHNGKRRSFYISSDVYMICIMLVNFLISISALSRFCPFLMIVYVPILYTFNVHMCKN